MVRKETVEDTPVTEVQGQEEVTPFDEFVEHERKAVQEFGKAFSALLPEGLREHGKSGVEEMVEGYRRLFNSTLDDIIKRIEKSKIEARPLSKKTKVTIK